MDKKVELIKVACDIFEDEKMMLIGSMDDGYGITVAWFKLLCLAGKRDGKLNLKDGVPYTDKMLATVFQMPYELVAKALDIFRKFGMIADKDGVIEILNWDKYQGDTTAETTKVSKPRVARANADDYPTQFVEFWEAYPRKDDKAGAYKEYMARLRDGFSPEELLDAERNYIAVLKRNHTEKKYTKMAKTFLSSTLSFEQYISKKKEKREVRENPFEEYGVL